MMLLATVEDVSVATTSDTLSSLDAVTDSTSLAADCLFLVCGLSDITFCAVGFSAFVLAVFDGSGPVLAVFDGSGLFLDVFDGSSFALILERMVLFLPMDLLAALLEVGLRENIGKIQRHSYRLLYHTDIIYRCRQFGYCFCLRASGGATI
jgi:hypothetical protein